MKSVIYTNTSKNKKIGYAAATYVSQITCPTTCPLLHSGCYAEKGVMNIHTMRLNQATANGSRKPDGRNNNITPSEVTTKEVEAIDNGALTPRKPLRLHVVGDTVKGKDVRNLSGAATRYRNRGGGPVWTYTHAWREHDRSDWGNVSVLASCQTKEEVKEAQQKGFATAIIVDEFTDDPSIIPCVEQTHGIQCSECKLCFNDKSLLKKGKSIGFRKH